MPSPGGHQGPGGLQKRGLNEALTAVQKAHPRQVIELWFQDEARVGQQGRVTHRWYERGVRPCGLHDQRHASTFIFGAVCPARDTGAALVITETGTQAMNLFLQEVSHQVAPNAHALVAMDRAGWHTTPSLVIPSNLSLTFQPAYSPELNPMERVWEYLRENHLSHRLLVTLDAVIDATCSAWNLLLNETGRICSLASFPWLPKVRTS